MVYLEQSEQLIGYKVKIIHRPAFRVTGFTALIPADAGGDAVARFWDEIAGDGRLEKLQKASSVPPWLLGLGSWDPECEKKGFRCTVCIEETDHTNFSSLKQEYPLFTKEIGESDWMCFEMTEDRLMGQFWKDNPYQMMKPLGFKFYAKDASVGLHFDAYPPDFVPGTNAMMEFWITVTRRARVSLAKRGSR